MDQKDEIILKTLMRNSRTPVTHIAEKVGMTETAVRKRIKKLEEIGAIKAYTALIDPYFVGYTSVALVGLDTKPEKLFTVFERIKDREDVRCSALTSGDHMIMFELWCKDQKQMAEVIKEIEDWDGVTKICPAILMKRME